MEVDTESLRAAAPQWSLAGDQQLLGVLQNIHERLVSKCQETNKHLGEMAAALDDASIDLQNVNNKFMALSNSQFIESRVYDDDDADITTTHTNNEQQKPTEIQSEVDQIKLGLQILEDLHEPLVIVDSESDTDSDDDNGRTVLKPKDLYEDRPLPYIIGSYAWQTKWHAGLLPSDSDSESVKRDPWERDEYSESDTDVSKPVQNVYQEQESSCSSNLSTSVSQTNQQTAAQKAACIAAQLAKREVNMQQQPDEPHEEYSPPAPVTKVYRPEKPAISNIFPDEPPPLEKTNQSDDDYEDDDIFAELRKNQPYTTSNKVQSSITDELFGRNQSGFGEQPPTANQKSSLFSEEQEPELFEQPPPLPKPDVTTVESNVKKPVGGISLFGNKGTESIGAAILKRNQRQSSTDEEASEEVNKPEKDIFDHLFAKSEKEQKKAVKKIEKAEKEIIKEAKVEKKIDLFSDNIFDDIDDIFTSNIPKIPIKSAEKNQKSLFDDDDDLFSEVTAVKSKNESVKDTKDNKKSIFDSDDDLFTEKDENSSQTKSVLDKIKSNTDFKKETSVKSESNKSIFDSDDDLFTDKDKASKTQSVVINKQNENKNNSDVKPEASIKSNSKKSIFDSDDELFTEKPEKQTGSKSIISNRGNNETVQSKSKSVFDDDVVDIFSETKPKEITVSSVVKSNEVNVDEINKNQTTSENRKIAPIPSVDAKKPLLFDDEDEDLFKPETSKDIFKNANKNYVENTEPPFTNVNEETKSTFDDKFEDGNKNMNKNSEINTERDKVKNIPEKSSFDDDSEEQLFSSKSYETRKDEKSIGSLNNDFDGDDLFKDINVHKTSESREQILKNEIKDEILDIKEAVKNEIKDEVLNELKDDLLVNKNDADSQNMETCQTVIPIIDDKNKTAKKSSIFDDVENELFSSYSINNETKVDKHNNDNKIPEVDTASKVSKPEIAQDRKINEEPPLFKEPKEQLFDDQNEFSDIFIEPPKFEKPKEPKRSKNVNALFDDDSDDEALFFKKDDPTLDEKPEFESPSTENKIFGIFQDEPPDLDIDFVQKSNVKTKIDSSTGITDTKKVNLSDQSSKDQLDANLTVKPKEVDIKDNVDKSSELSTKDKVKSEAIKEADKTDNAQKPVGKLKTMNFNINVNALLPGASPKKVKSTEQIDGNTQTKSSEDISTKNEPEPESKMVKSISFEGKPDSQVLDNKLSKERPRIQVKRRPSTRRARMEAVRKSGIDFGDDSTDNSSSIDDQPKIIKKDQTKDPIPKSDDKNASQVFEKPKDDRNNTVIERKEPNKSNLNTFDSNNDLITPVIDVTSKIESNSNLSNEHQPRIEKESSEDSLFQKPKVTTKTVYILNDEDIFNVEKPKKVLNIIDDDNPGFSTLGKVYKDVKSDSDSDDELFKNVNVKAHTKDSGKKVSKPETEATDNSDEKLFETKPNNKSTKSVLDNKNEDLNENLFKPDTKSKSKGIFDLSDDEDLFTKSNDETSEVFKKEVKKVDVKASLFDDDDDLFGSGRSKKNDPSTSHHRTKEVITKSSEPVFEDPLSMLGEDDD